MKILLSGDQRGLTNGDEWRVNSDREAQARTGEGRIVPALEPEITSTMLVRTETIAARRWPEKLK